MSAKQKPSHIRATRLGAEFAKGINNATGAWIKDMAVGEGLAFAFGCLAGGEFGCVAPGGAAAFEAIPITLTSAGLHATYLTFKPVVQYAYKGYVCNNPQDTFF